MELLLLRHGIAATPEQAHCTDAERPLTKEGIEKMRLAAAGMKRCIDSIDLILTSPLRRTMQTAELASEAFQSAGAPQICEELSLGGSGKRMLDILSAYHGKRTVLLVGHEPELIELFSLLTGARQSAVELKKGALISLSIVEFGAKPRGVLLWHLTSKQLRLIGGR